MDINAKKVRQPRHSVVGGLGLAGFAGMGPPDHSTCPVTLPHALPPGSAFVSRLTFVACDWRDPQALAGCYCVAQSQCEYY